MTCFPLDVFGGLLYTGEPMRRNYLLAAALASLFLGAAVAQSPDPLVGTWQLNRGKSDFQPPSTLMSRTITFEIKAGAVRVVQRTVTQQGNTVEIEYFSGYDGKDVPISNSPLDTVSLKRVNANVVERTGRIRGEVIETATMTLSADKKVLTITTKGSVNGSDYSSTQVFERQ